ncbi:MAG TPA: SgcJ/EcaC family oxidoreductase [Puia sp.]|nr:SgcJ/EcaC family oxidoreductase [Puia sp.]
MNPVLDSHITLSDEAQVKLLYKQLLESWNKNNADEFAGHFASNGTSIGFDGSQMNSQQEINEQLLQVFSNHKVASYIGIVREVRALSPTVMVLRAVAGMVPPGQTEIKPEVNAIQTLIAQKQGAPGRENFLIAVFQNTPAAFHGRPGLTRQLTEELQQAWNKK